MLQILDPIFYFLTGTLATPRWLDTYIKNHFFSRLSKSDSISEIRLEFSISELESMPECRELCDALSMLLVWVRM